MKKIEKFLPSFLAVATASLWLLAGSGCSGQGSASGSRNVQTVPTRPTVTGTAPAAEQAPANPTHGGRELWYELRIGDAPAGFMFLHERREGLHLITESTLRLEIRRAGSQQSLEIRTRFDESPDHKPLSAWVRQDLGQIPMETFYEVDGDEVLVRGAAGERRVPLPEGPWLTPFAESNALERRLDEVLSTDPVPGSASFELTTLDPNAGLQAVTTTWTLVDPSVTVMVAGKPRPASRWHQSQSYVPGIVSTVDVDHNGDILRSTTPMMGLEMAIVLSDKSSVEKASVDSAERGASAPPELLTPSFIYPDRTIENPRALRSATYRLLRAGDDAPATPSSTPTLPETAVQTVEVIDGGVRIHVDLDAALARKPGAGKVDLEDRELYLRSTDFLQHDAAPVRALLRPEILQGAATAAQKAEALRRLVGRHLVSKNLDSVLAGAVEAAQNGAGDCTEHAVLLAALLRAVDIPSRVATGVIYAEAFAGERDLFGYHMWTQAWIDGRWLDLDATLEVPFDAGHITMAWSALADSSSALVDLAAAAPWMGRVRIEIESLGYEALGKADDADKMLR